MSVWASWPKYDEALCHDDEVEVAVQINGKVKDRLTVSVDASDDEVITAAKSRERIASELIGKNVLKAIYVRGRLVNIVAK